MIRARAVASGMMLATVRARAPAIDWIAAIIIGHHHTRPVNSAAAGAAMAGDSAGRISITVSCLSGARTEKRETGDEGEECEEFFHRGFGWRLGFDGASRCHYFRLAPAGFIHGCDGLRTTIRFGVGRRHREGG